MDLSKTMPNSVEDNSVEPRASSSSTSTDDNEDDIFKTSAWSSSTSNDDNGDNIFEPSACSSSTLVDYVPNLSPVEPLSHQLVEDDLHVGNLPATVEDLPQMVYLWTEAEPDADSLNKIRHDHVCHLCDMVFNTKNLYKEHNRSEEHLDLDEKMRAKFGLQNSAAVFFKQSQLIRAQGCLSGAKCNRSIDKTASIDESAPLIDIRRQFKI
ncbi:uncharacterized protein LOC119546350 [Drosophila subpulchrella]|uniref:uncharacterized protein LOC119546350 n=1 Tax=Drosophila subpulchrella TaxID=1486046 RepID=UPI0018A19C14|nr:uncharacterized protein LOC119546350 [Drosophila subpulchrella]